MDSWCLTFSDLVLKKCRKGGGASVVSASDLREVDSSSFVVFLGKTLNSHSTSLYPGD